MALHLLQHGSFPEGASKAQRDKASKRREHYQWQQGKLLRRMPDGTLLEVPPPDQRDALVKSFHRTNGHLGQLRTAALVGTAYWWNGLCTDAARVVSQCPLCDRVRASFSGKQPQLHPLPIIGLFYRWGVDLCGDFEPTPSGSKYAMVCIEHFSRFVVIVALPDKSARSTALAFGTGVLAHFGACAEVLTDCGREFQGEFDQLCLHAMIDHRRNSPHHPSTNGAAERCVQTLKRALRKLCEQHGKLHDWDLHLPWLTLGYNASPQQSTGYSPYMLLYGRVPTVPPATRERLASPLDFADASATAPEELAEDLVRRARAMQQACAMAGSNLAIAQHRDTLRYASLRDGRYQPKLVRFSPGDYVYLHNPQSSTLQISARPQILRVKRAGNTGTLTLEGRDGRTVDVNAEQCAPCHLANIDTATHTGLRVNLEDTACEQCGSRDQEAYMLLCDSCSKGWHTFCLPRPLLQVPSEPDWICPTCERNGVSLDGIRHQRLLHELQQRQEARQLRTAQELHGATCSKTTHAPGTDAPTHLTGTISFDGGDARKRCMHILWSDGTREGPLLPRQLCHLYGPIFATPPPNRTRSTRSAAQRSPLTPAPQMPSTPAAHAHTLNSATTRHCSSPSRSGRPARTPRSP